MTILDCHFQIILYSSIKISLSLFLYNKKKNRKDNHLLLSQQLFLHIYPVKPEIFKHSLSKYFMFFLYAKFIYAMHLKNSSCAKMELTHEHFCAIIFHYSQCKMSRQVHFQNELDSLYIYKAPSYTTAL